MIRFVYQFPVYDRASNVNVFDWIIAKSKEFRKDRKLVREFQYRALILSRESDGKLSKEKSQEAGQTPS